MALVFGLSLRLLKRPGACLDCIGVLASANAPEEILVQVDHGAKLEERRWARHLGEHGVGGVEVGLGWDWLHGEGERCHYAGSWCRQRGRGGASAGCLAGRLAGWLGIGLGVEPTHD